MQNIPQLIIQISYLTTVTSSNFLDNNLIIYLSLVFTILSLLISMTQTGVVLLSLCNEFNNKVLQLTEIEIKTRFHSKYFTNQHAFCAKSIQTCLLNTIRKNDINGFWTDRTDVGLSCEVFYIHNKISFNKEIEVYSLFTLSSYSSFGKDNHVSHVAIQSVDIHWWCCYSIY